MIDRVRVTYRDATIADAAALAEISRETFVATFGALYPVADLKHFLAHAYGADIQAAELADPQTRHRLAECEGALIGFAKMGAFKLPCDTDGRRAAELHRLYLIADAKAQGVSDTLMDWTIAQARAMAAQDLYLGVYQGNARAQRFYTRFGFEIVGEYQFAVGSIRDPEYIMRRRLEA